MSVHLLQKQTFVTTIEVKKCIASVVNTNTCIKVVIATVVKVTEVIARCHRYCDSLPFLHGNSVINIP